MAGIYLFLYIAVAFVAAVPIAAKICGKGLFEFIAEDDYDD